MSASVTRLQRALRVCYFGHKPVNYLEASELQTKLANYCRSETSLDTVLQLQVHVKLVKTYQYVGDLTLLLSPYHRASVQHSNVYTLGKRGVQAHFKVPAAKLAQQGFDIQQAGRGGETTYHGPGQLVMYPVVNLRRLGIGARVYVETLEDCMVAACSHFGIEARVCSVHKTAKGSKQVAFPIAIMECLFAFACSNCCFACFVLM